MVAFFLLSLANLCFSQSDTAAKKYQVAVFTPLYLDSAFDQNNDYRYGKNFPRFFNPGLEFYEGIQLAIDSLQKEGVALDVHIYDTRSSKSPVFSVINSVQFSDIDLMIGHVNANEAKILADAAAVRNIPFINATYPNDAGITNNPNFILLNSTLFTHCTAMYKFLQKNFALAPIVLFRKKGQQEDRLKNYFETIGKSTASVPLKIKYVTLEDEFTGEDLKSNLDANTTNICIAGSLDINFGERLTQQLSALYEAFPAIIFAMPTWWDVANFTKPEYKSVEVYFSTPFYLPPTNKLASAILQDYKTRFYSRPTDMVFRGYETLYHFAHLLTTHGKNFGSSLSDKAFKLFTDFDIQPSLDPKTMTLNYFENKKIYFIKKVDGVVTAVY